MSLPPPPINDQPGSFTWLEWYRQLRNYISTSGSVPWYIINFSGSNLTDIATRDHDATQGLQGGTAGEHYHLTAAQHAALSAGNHNDLTGLQGGTTNQYYHLTSAEQTALAASTQGTWNPTFTSLTEVPGTGAITKTGRYSRVGRTVFYTISISCTGTATTAATAGTTYSDIPIAAAYDDTVTSANATVRGGHGSVESGILDATNDRCYVPSWSATGNTIIISGKYEV